MASIGGVPGIFPADTVTGKILFREDAVPAANDMEELSSPVAAIDVARSLGGQVRQERGDARLPDKLAWL